MDHGDGVGRPFFDPLTPSLRATKISDSFQFVVTKQLDSFRFIGKAYISVSLILQPYNGKFDFVTV